MKPAPARAPARAFALLLLALTTPVRAADTGEPMSAAEFESYTTGHTLYYGFAGQEYGAEQYLPGRKVRWSVLDGKCREGFWYEAGAMICFKYLDTPTPQCWTFYKIPGGIRARYENEPRANDLYETRKSDEPLLCLGPEVGV